MFVYKPTINALIPIISALILFNLFGCSSKQTEIVHPQDERLPSIDEVDYVYDMSKNNPDLLSQFSFLDSLNMIGSIGVQVEGIGKQTEVNSVYYYPRDSDRIDIDPNGYLYFLQYHTNSIVVYSRTGEYQYSIGRGGRGPGEFTDLITFVFDEDYQTLYVLDDFELEIFELMEGQYKYKETIFLNYRGVYDMCILNDNLYLSGFTLSKNDTTNYKSDYHRSYMHKVTPPITRINLTTMEPELYFGFEYRTEYGYGWQEGALSKMMLSCNQASNTIVGYQIDFPFIFGYSPDGNLKWTSFFDNLKTAQYTEFIHQDQWMAGLKQQTHEGRVYRKKPLPAFNFKHYEIVQLYLSSPIQRMGSFDPDLVVRKRDYHTFLLNTETGELFRSDAYPLIKLIKDHTYITAKADTNTFEHAFYIHEF